jgi:hypothetical protein
MYFSRINIRPLPRRQGIGPNSRAFSTAIVHNKFGKGERGRGVADKLMAACERIDTGIKIPRLFDADEDVT